MLNWRWRRYYKLRRRGRNVGPWRRQVFRGRRRANPAQIILAIFLLGSLIWFIYFFLASANFKIKTVNITGASSVPQAELEAIVKSNLEERRWLLFRNDNLILFSKKNLRARIAKKYLLEAVILDRDWPATLNVVIQEKPARLLLRTKFRPEPSVAGEASTSTRPAVVAPGADEEINYYYLDVNGLVVSVAPNIGADELTARPVVEIELERQTLLKPGQTLIDQERVKYVFSLYEAARQSSAQIKISHVILDPKTADEVRFATSEGWQVMVTKKLALSTQIKKLELALREKIKEKRSILQYVDLRIQDRVYFK